MNLRADKLANMGIDEVRNKNKGVWRRFVS
jgi:hypothetical protein